MAKQQFLCDVAGTFQVYLWENNRKVVPSSATLTVYKPGVSTKLIDAQTMTIAGDGKLSYALTATHNARPVWDNTALTIGTDGTADNYSRPMYENYKAVITYVVGGVTYYTTVYYDVVRSILKKVIHDDDIIRELPQIKDKGYVLHVTADSGSATTAVSSELKRHEDDYFTGGLLTNLSNGEVREITDFVSSTGTLTIATATAIVAGNKLVVQRSFTREIDRAFEKINDLLNRAGRRAYLILDSEDVRELHIYYSVAEVCKGFMNEQDGMWWALWQEYDKKAYAVFKSLNLKYDESDDGYLTRAELDQRVPRRIGRG